MLYQNRGYLDPIHIVWRSGREDDPYIDRMEYLKVVNQKMVLAEIPDRFHRVKIDGLKEINVERITRKHLEENEYAVDYASGFILVHEKQEAQTFNVKYKGRGFIQYPSTRIYHNDQFNNVVLSLEEIINRALESVKHLNDSIDGKISDYQQIRDLLLDKISKMDIATDNANTSAQDAKDATKLAESAYDTTRLVFKEHVTTKSEIINKYPHPEVGWTTQVYETGIRYRYDGKTWVPIDLFGGNIQDASLKNRGLMSKETYKQLQDLDKYVKDWDGNIEERVLVFSLPYVMLGINNVIARFPYKGQITSVRAVCLRNGDDSITEVDIEKTYDFEDWHSVFESSYITIEPKENEDDGNVVVRSNDELSPNQVLRVNVKNHSIHMEALTIEVTVRILK